MSTRYFSCSCHLQLDKICPHDNDPFNARRMRTDWTVADFNGLSKHRLNVSMPQISVTMTLLRVLRK